MLQRKVRVPPPETKVSDGLGFLLHKRNSKRQWSSAHGCLRNAGHPWLVARGSWRGPRGPKAAEGHGRGAPSCTVCGPSRQRRPEHGLPSAWKPEPRTACGRLEQGRGASPQACADPALRHHPDAAPEASLPEPETRLFSPLHRACMKRPGNPRKPEDLTGWGRA